MSYSVTCTSVAATLTGIGPSSGSVGSTVTLTGTAFYGTSAVSFGTTAATSFTVNSDTSITATVPSLALGAYNVTVTTDAGTTSAVSFGVTPTAPDGPVIGTATAGDAEATVSFSPPASDGGAAITGYTVTASPGGATGTGAASPITVTGLTNGTAYSFTVTATNSVGTGAASAASNSITPQGAQTITFDVQQPRPTFVPNGTFALDPVASASSGLPVTYTSLTPGGCTISGTTVTMLTADQCTIAADQAGDASYSAAQRVTQSIVIQKAAQAITFDTQAGQLFVPSGTFALNPVASASSGLPVAYSSDTSNVCTISGTAVTMLSSGRCIISANQAGDINYVGAVTVQQSMLIQANQAITNFAAAPVAPVYARNGTFTVSATGGGSANPVVFRNTSPSVCTVGGNTVNMRAAGTCSLTADQAADTNYTAAPQVTLIVEIGAASQAITGFTANPSAPVFAPNGTFTVTATGGASTSPVAFASTSAAVCTVNGNTVTMLIAGNCALTADQAGDANYLAAPQVALDVAIGSASQAISGFSANPTAPVFTPNGTFTISAIGGASGNSVTFASTSAAVCSVAGNTVTMLTAGTCALTADQAGDASYGAAQQATLDVAIGPAAQAITGFTATPSAPVFTPNGTFTVTATGGASASPVIFASTSATVCTVSGSTVTMLSAGACALTADQASDANYAAAPQVTLDIAIGSASQAITGFTANPSAPVFTPNGTFSVAATGGASSSPVTFVSTSSTVCTVNGSTVTMLAAGTCALTADQASDANYAAAPQVTLDIAIGSASQAITGFIATPAAPVFAPNGTLTVAATGGASGNPVTFASTSAAVCTVSGSAVTMLSAGTCALTADQAGNANYGAAAQATLDVVIGAAMPTLAWAAPLQKLVGATAFDLPVPSSNSSGAFTYSSSAPSVATVSGRTVTIVGPGVATLVATQAAAGNYTGGTVSTTLTVDARPDPTRDPAVVGGLQAQVDASVRFAAAQQANIGDRLRQLRNGDGSNPSSNGLAVATASRHGTGPALALGTNALAGAMAPAGWGVWTAGMITLGDRDARDGSSGFDFRSDGVSFGMDRRLGPVVLGAAAGLGRNASDFDDPGSDVDADQSSLSVYGLWRGTHWYAEGQLGHGRLDFDLRRWSQPAGAVASAKREGDQDFGSLSVGYAQRTGRMQLTGYGRLDASRTTLDAYRESGLGLYDLAYREQAIDSRTLALGVEGSYQLQGAARAWRPFWSLEYRDALRNDGDAEINYVVQPLASDYVLGLRSYNQDTWALGVGFDVALASSWQLSLLLRHERSADGVDANGLGLRLVYLPAPQATAPAP